MIRKDELELESALGDDIQINVHDLNQDQKKKSKYPKLKNGYFSAEKLQYELNYAGNVVHQLNFQFEFNKQKAIELIDECKSLFMTKIGKKSQDVQKEEVKVSNTHSQLMSSSYGNDFYYDIDCSEIDDLDNEVSNIAKKFTQNNQKKQSFNNKNIAENDNKISSVDHEDIQLQLNDKPELKTFQNEEVKIVVNESNETKPSDSEEKQKFEERKLFEGQNINIWASKLLKYVLQSIKIIGFNTNKIPAITNLSHLMNSSFYLRKDKYYLEDNLEVDFILGTLLVSSKRNTQAVEILRNKVQSVYLKQIDINKAKL